jgi:hypothetical protein
MLENNCHEHLRYKVDCVWLVAYGAVNVIYWHGRMVRGDDGLPKVSPGPAIPYASMTCGWATPEMALKSFQG